MLPFLLITYPDGWGPEETHHRHQAVLQEMNERCDDILDPIEMLQPGEPICLGNLTPEAFGWLQFKVADFTIRGFIYGECFCPGPCSSTCIIRELKSKMSARPTIDKVSVLQTDDEQSCKALVQPDFAREQIAWEYTLAAAERERAAGD